MNDYRNDRNQVIFNFTMQHCKTFMFFYIEYSIYMLISYLAALRLLKQFVGAISSLSLLQEVQ